MIAENLHSLISSIPDHVELVAVSKTKPTSDITAAYEAGQRHFGENKVQEMVQKQETLPKDICWHLIGHLQTNKVKYIAPFVHLIHAVDSLKLLKEINKQLFSQLFSSLSWLFWCDPVSHYLFTVRNNACSFQKKNNKKQNKQNKNRRKKRNVHAERRLSRHAYEMIIKHTSYLIHLN